MMFLQVISRYAYSTQRVKDIGQPTPASHPHVTIFYSILKNAFIMLSDGSPILHQLIFEGEVTPGIRIEEYIGRRKKLAELLPQNSLAIVSSAPVKMMTDVVPYTFRQEADYLYLTGCQQPGGVAVLSSEHGLCMFMPESTPNVRLIYLF